MTIKNDKKCMVLFLFLILMLLIFSGFSAPPGAGSDEAAEESDHHPKISEDRLFYFEKKQVAVNEFHSQGYILDIGGGGRGVIGELKGEQVIAIDISKQELEGAPAGPLKIIMDATDLKFLDSTFSTATSFFTFMYIKEPEHEKVFDEVFMALIPGGLFLIWNVIFTERFNADKDIAVFPLLIKLPDKEIDAGYGVLWPEKGRDLSHYLKLAENEGFNVVAQKEKDQMFYLELRKP